ncbi:hypothetical protein [Streptomyces peucetius]|uniref:DUF4440 domain-containing protein n=1 Tax=Streptomyces peucetius TaxID=1950 RepID=A0ABY6IGW9_STRPE|nr:hypothetical protein [Streptomyces peucetius]UYQ65979.1 hypothetical protein OGH68_33975 [Streptomyces peucetius]
MDVAGLRALAELGQPAEVLAGGDRAALADRGDLVELRDDVLAVFRDLTEPAFGQAASFRGSRLAWRGRQRWAIRPRRGPAGPGAALGIAVDRRAR